MQHNLNFEREECTWLEDAIASALERRQIGQSKMYVFAHHAAFLAGAQKVLAPGRPGSETFPLRMHQLMLARVRTRCVCVCECECVC